MPSAVSDSGPDSRFMVEQTGRMLRSLMAADRDLLRAAHRELESAQLGRRHPERRPIMPTLTTAQNLQTKLRFVYGWDTEKKILFGLLGTKRLAVKLADIRLGLGISPADGPPSRLEAEPILLAALPRFVEHGGPPDGIAVRLVTGRRLNLAAANLRTQTVWNVQQLVDLIDAIADAERRQRFGALRRLRPRSGGRLDELLETVIERFGDLGDEMAALRRPAQARGDIQRALVARYADHYDFTRLQARILVNLDSRGELIEEPDQEDRQQIDVTLEHLPDDGGVPQIKARFHVPDLLVEGSKFHDGFAEILSEEAAENSLFDSKLEKYFRDQRAFGAFLRRRSTRSSSVFIRTERKEEDVDYALLRGRTDGGLLSLLFRLELTAERFPDVRIVEIVSGRLVASQRASEAWQSHEDEDLRALTRYLQRLLLIVQDWRNRMEAP